MNCKKARLLIIRRVTGRLDSDEQSALDKHLKACPRCKNRMERYKDVFESVQDVETPNLPDEVSEACKRALDKVRSAGQKPTQAPANPEPIAGFWRRTGIFSLCLLILAAIAVGAVLVASRYSESLPETGRIVYRSGTLKVGYPGGTQWHKAPPRTRLDRDTILQTAEDGFLRVRTPSAVWWIDSNTTVAFPDPSTIRVANGRIYAEQAGEASRSINVTTPHGGRVETIGGNGRFEVRATPARLIATSKRGSLSLQGKDTEVVIEAGQRAMILEGKTLPTKRTVNPGKIAPWKRRFGTKTRDAISREQARILPEAPGSANIPEHIRVRHLRLRCRIRGPLVLLMARAKLRNDGEQSWRGELDPKSYFWPRPLLSASSGSVRIRPGETTSVDMGGIAALAPDADNLTFGVFTGLRDRRVDRVDFALLAKKRDYESVRELTLDLEARSDGANMRIEKQVETPSGETPLVLSLKPREESRPGAVAFATDNGGRVIGLGGWLPGFKPDTDIQKTRHFLLGYDAAGYKSKAGRTYAHELAENIVGSLKPRARIMVAAYDGELKMLPSPGPAASAVARDRMLASLWELESGEVAEGWTPLLKWCAGFPAQQPSLAFVISPLARAGSEFPATDEGARPRSHLIQTGPEDIPKKVGELCASFGGAAEPVPNDLSPEAAAVHLLRNLQWSGYETLSLKPQPPVDASFLTRTGAPSNTPLIWLFRSEESADGVSGTVKASTRQQKTTTSWTFTPRNTTWEGLNPELRKKLMRDIEDLLN